MLNYFLPKKREEVYNEIGKILGIEAYEVTGDVDIVVKTSQKNVENVIKAINNMEGVTKTTTYGVVKKLC